MLIENRKSISSTFFFIFFISLIIMLVDGTNPNQIANRRSIRKESETRIQGDVNVEEEQKMNSEEHKKGHKDCEKTSNENKENTGDLEIDFSESGLKREPKNGLERMESGKREEKRGNGRRNSELAKALRDEEGIMTSEKPAESTTMELATTHQKESTTTIQTALEFDTFAPGFFPSSPGFSTNDENKRSTTKEEKLDENEKKNKGEEEEEGEMVLMDSMNGTKTTIGDQEEENAKNGSRFWEFERVEIRGNKTSPQNIIELTTENATILADISPNNETTKANDTEIVIGWTEASILDRDIEQLTTIIPIENGTEMDKKLGKRPDSTAFFPNNTKNGCDDESNSHEEKILAPNAQKNAAKLLKKPETEFFAGVDELNDNRENWVAEEMEQGQMEDLEKRKAKALPELAVKIGINATKEAIQMIVDKTIGTEQTRTTLAKTAEERKTTTTTLSTPLKWTPYTFDCTDEMDDRGELLCQEWAKGGLCEINKATRFLFCRRTCLCIGFQN